MNTVNLIGRITKELKLEVTKSDHKVLRFSIAVNNGKDKDATFVNCQAWNKTAEVINQYFGKGSRIGIIGRIDTNNYLKDGKMVYNTFVTVNQIEFLDSKQEDKKEPVEEYKPNNDLDIPDDLPF